ncbi:type I methionyl aminopeptidase [Cohnella pontilimi]|uniref:Methionine aminopeptidase n=1 Tax=Cohnella pontilimi TaxID=2564100 RepID=A0A4U0FCS3_9BACL|nr:type I methionyl aminopeptidase [Cohnella pontilimi]TJY41082.1 type I methionyl aminopeptidase [Cohnella pontilimi]
MTVGTLEDLEHLKEIGRIVASTIQEMKRSVRVGMTTRELDDIGGELLRRQGAVSAPKKVYNFPGYTCISVNRAVAHGVPGDQVIQPGDLINIDVCAEKNGYVADAGHSFQIPPYSEAVTRLCRHTHDTMMKVISSLKHGVLVSEIGKIVEREAAHGGYRVIKTLCSHGVGRSIHEYPEEILPVYNRRDKRVLTEGLVITVEPFLSTGAEHVWEERDGWTLTVPDGCMAAQHEHTIVITRDQPIILTVA